MECPRIYVKEKTYACRLNFTKVRQTVKNYFFDYVMQVISGQFIGKHI